LAVIFFFFGRVVARSTAHPTEPLPAQRGEDDHGYINYLINGFTFENDFVTRGMDGRSEVVVRWVLRN